MWILTFPSTAEKRLDIFIVAICQHPLQQGPWGQAPGGSHVGLLNLAIWILSMKAMLVDSGTARFLYFSEAIRVLFTFSLETLHPY